MRLLSILAILGCVFQLAAGELHIAVLSDLHVSPGNGNDKVMPQLVEAVNADGSDLVVVTGDLTNCGSDAELANVHKRLLGIQKPLYVIPGNHETNWSESAGLGFARLWGDEKFAVKRDGVVLVGFSTGPYLKMGDGCVRSEDIAFLRESLAKLAGNGEPVIVFCHYPLAPELGNGPAIAELLRKYNVVAVVGGHTHRQARRTIYGLDTIACRPLSGGDAYGYNLLRFDGAKTVEAVEKRLGEKQTFPVEQLPPVNVKPVPQEAPLPPGVAVDLLYADSASVYTGVAVSEQFFCYGTSDGRLVVRKLNGGPGWERKFGFPFYSTPVFFGGMIGVGMTGVPGGNGAGCVALIPEIGRFSSVSEVFLPTPGPVTGGGTVYGGKLYIGGGKGEFLRVDPSGKAVKNDSAGFGTMQGRPAVVGGLVVFGAWDTNLYALDAETLEFRWKWNNGKSQVLYSPGNVVPVIGNGQVIIVAPDRFMTALDLRTGKQIWRSNAFQFRESLGGSEDGDTAYAKTMDGKLAAVETGEEAFAAKWVCDLKFGYDHAPCPVLEADGIVYAGSRDGVIAAVDAKSGELLWRFRGGDSAVNEFTSGPDGNVYATLVEGKIYRIKVKSREGANTLRVVSLSPNLTEMIATLGAEKLLVGRTSACDRPESVKSLPVVGTLGAPSMEALVAVRPALVVAEVLRNPADAEALQSFGIRVELFHAANFDDYFRNLERLGALLGRKEKAEKAVARARRKLEAWREADAGLPDRRRPKVLVAIDVSPVITAGKRSFLTSMIELAGGRNVAAGEDRGYFNCSLEQIALWDPDVILVPGLPAEKLRELEQSPAWSGLSAVKRGNVVTDFDPDLLYRLGPRSLDGIETLRELLSERFKR